MTAKNYDLCVAYRIYPDISKEPFIFQTNKFELAKNCLLSFKNSLGKLRVKLYVLLDNCPQEYDELFKKYFCKENLILIKLDGIGNGATFNKQIDILCSQNHSEYIYFAEDDYLYQSNEFESLLKFLKNPGVDFISPYDHPDDYECRFQKRKDEIRIFDRRHWRRANTTCLTFLTKKEILTQTKDIFKTFAKGNHDSSLWLSLTKHRITNPYWILKSIPAETFYIKSMVKSWIYCWKQILFGKKYKLWIPIPSIATHLEKTKLAPVVDWKNIASQFSTTDKYTVNQ
jgi:hypothetical protein